MKNFYLRTIYFSNGVFVFGYSLVVPIFALYLNDFNVDIVQISLTSTIFMVATAFFLLILSLIGDKIQHKSRLLVLAFILRGIVWVSYIFAKNIEMVYFLQIFAGLGEAVGSTIFAVIVAEHLDEGNHVEDYSIWNLIQAVAGGLAAVFGGFIVQTLGFNYLFGLMGFLALMAAFIFIYGMRQSTKRNVAQVDKIQS